MSDIGIESPQRAFLSNNVFQLKHLKKQVLRDAYEQEANQRQPRRSINPQANSNKNSEEGSIRSSHSMQLLPIHDLERQQSIKNMLKNSYDEDISRKQREKQEEKKQIREQRDSLNYLHNHSQQNHFFDKKRAQKEEYAKILDSQVKKKQELRLELGERVKKQRQEEEVRLKKRRLGALQKQTSFREYFNKVNQFRDSVSSDYLKYLVSSPKKQVAKISPDRQMMQQHQRTVEIQHSEQRRKNSERKHELRMVLQKQIMQNRSFKESQKHDYKNRGYIKTDVNTYNPISNPIDYQLDLNNKYILKEIIRKQNDGSNRVYQ